MLKDAVPPVMYQSPAKVQFTACACTLGEHVKQARSAIKESQSMNIHNNKGISVNI